MNSILKFTTDSFIDALKSFFEELKVPIDYLAEEPASPSEVLGDRYKATNEAHKLINDVYALGMVNDAIFEGTETFKTLSQVKKLNADYDGLLIFGVTLNKKPTRTHLAEITRIFNRVFPYTPVTIIFKYQNFISLSNSERFKYKQEWREGEKVGKVSLLMNVDCSLDEHGKLKTHQGHKRILKAISIDSIKEYDRKNKVESFSDLYRGWQQVFSTNILNEQFYKDYQQLSIKLIRAIYPSKIKDKLKAHQGALNILNRMMFVYFIQKKGWLMNDTEFLYHFWQDYKDSKSSVNTFHEKWINKVFFKAFNGKAFSDPEIFKILPTKYHEAIIEFPYLNGGLFTPNEEDNFILDDKHFEEIFKFLQGYIFTITEDTPDEINLEINPELLGKMYEGMINATDLNDVDAENGIVYTERPEINFMTRRSFVEVLNKKLPDSYSREFLYHFCFDKPLSKLELLKKYKVNDSELRASILSITALDPSCGSGSMLIGVIQLQIELIRAIDEYSGKIHTPKDDFYLKKQIISESIYGVDIKEWAVRIAELRFWLYMIAEAEFTQEELTKEPLLPNLDFKLRQGNSLLQEIGNLDFSVKGLFKGRKRNIGASRKLSEFIKKKKDFISNQSKVNTSYKKLKEEEIEVFKEFIKEIIFENTNIIKRLSRGNGQQDIFGSEKKGNLFETQIETLEKENDKLYRILSTIKSTGRIPFSYDIDFMEIFLAKEDAGFDLIIGNPPYVRQEDILPAEDAIELERLLLPKNKVEKSKINKAYKEKLSAKVFETYPFLRTKAKTQINGKNKLFDIYGNKVPGRSDLYVYFQLLMPSLLNNKGTFCFIISNSWLDVEYGGFVQQFLLKHTQLHSIYDCNIRSFSASINTIIYLHSSISNVSLSESQYKSLKPQGKSVRFIMNKTDYTDAAYAPLLIEQEHCTENTFRNHYRIILVNPKDLWDEGFDEESHVYQSSKWGGKYLSGPEIMFRIMDISQEKKLTNQLKTFVTGERYLNTGGADGFFIIDDFEEKGDFFEIKNNSVTEEGLLKSVQPFQGKISKQFLKPLIKDVFKKNKKIIAENTDALCLVLHKNELDTYIKWGEENEYNERSVTKLQTPWFKPTNQMLNGAPILVPRSFNEVFAIHYNPKKYLSLRFYRLHPRNEENTLSLIGFLNSTLVAFFQETLGNKSLGQGALDFFMADFLRMKIPIILSGKFERILFNSLLNREIQTIFNELGFDKSLPIRGQDPRPMTDRKELDDIIFDELGLTNEERKEVYWSTAELVKQRLDKAASR